MSRPSFTLASEFAPSGDQPQAIEQLVSVIRSGSPHSVLLGVTGSGKTFTLANVIARLDRPALATVAVHLGTTRLIDNVTIP